MKAVFEVEYDDVVPMDTEKPQMKVLKVKGPLSLSDVTIADFVTYLGCQTCGRYLLDVTCEVEEVRE